MNASFEMFDKGWKFAGEREFVEREADIFRYSRGILFLLGSLLTVTGRYYEISDRSAVNPTKEKV